MMFQDTMLTLSVLAVTVTLPVALVLVVTICLPCFRKKLGGGFSNFSNNTEADTSSQGHSNAVFSPDIEDTSIDIVSSTSVTIEPLPEVAPKSTLPSCPLRPRIGCIREAKQDASLNLIAAHHPFPRNQIVYLKELGSGWFGKAIESDAEKIAVGIPRSKVVVKMLKDDASKDEQQLFFMEIAPFRELEHNNVMRLLGQCTETNPMLMILESAAFGNLKQYLRSHRHQQAVLIQKNRLIQFALDAASGLACLHGHDYLHRDLAARNCLVMSNHTLKIGDYGIAEDLFKEDYMTSGKSLLPIRWMAPETLKQENGTWMSQNFSKESDIWSLGVLLWEITMLGERPYDMLTDEAVLQGVIMDKDIRLPEPDIGMTNKDRLHEIMRFCWMEQSQRIKVDEIYKLLQQIVNKAPENGAAHDAITVFEQKWEHLMPNQRHASLGSIDERLGSFSSEDSNLTDNVSRPDSLENLTAPAPMNPQIPPRTSKKKLSAPAITIPNIDELSDIASAAIKEESTEQEGKAPPQILIDTGKADLKTSQVQPLQTTNLPKESVEPKEKPDLVSEFTEFTSHDISDSSVGGTPDVSQVFPSVQTPGKDDKLPLANDQRSEAAGDALDALAGSDIMPKVQATLEEGQLVMNTPDRPEARGRKTSTPIAKDDLSPSSSSSLSAGDSSSATFLTAQTSSPGYLTDPYATASDSTMVTGHTGRNFTSSTDFSVFEEKPSSTVSSSLSFEILDKTATPSVFSDFDTPAENSQNLPTLNPFSTTISSNQNLFTTDNNTIHKDNVFGEFTNASLGEGSHDPSLKSAPDPPQSVDLSLSSGTDASPAQADFYSFTCESPASVSNSQNIDTSSGITPPNHDMDSNNPFASFGTDLSSLNVPLAASSQDQPFPSFSSELSSLNSLDTAPTVTPQSETQINLFAFDQTVPSVDLANPFVPPEKSQTKSPNVDGFSFDILGSTPDILSNVPATNAEGLDVKSSTEAVSAGLSSNPLGDFSSIISAEKTSAYDQLTGLSDDARPDDKRQKGSEQMLTDLFGMADTKPVNQYIDTRVKAVPEPSSLSDFDILSGFSTASASIQNSADPFGGGLLQDLVGSPPPAGSGPIQKVGISTDNAGDCFSGEEKPYVSTASGSFSSSDVIKDQTDEELAGKTGIQMPDSNSVHIVMNIEKCANHVNSEADRLLLKGACAARLHETCTVSPTPGDLVHHISEEPSSPLTQSEAGSVEVKLEDVFQWDDFMGEPLVGKERITSGSESPKRSFDMPDWTLDSDSIRSCSSLHSERSGSYHKRDGTSDSQSTSSADTPNACSSVSDSEVILHGRIHSRRSYIAGLANRSEGLIFNTTPRSRHIQNLSLLYEDVLHLESQSQPEGNCSPLLESQSQTEGNCIPPAPNPTYKYHALPVFAGCSTLHAEIQQPYSSCEDREKLVLTNHQESQDDVLVAKASSESSKQADSTLFNFTEFESFGNAATGDKISPETKSSSESENVSSLINF